MWAGGVQREGAKTQSQNLWDSCVLPSSQGQEILSQSACCVTVAPSSPARTRCWAQKPDVGPEGVSHRVPLSPVGKMLYLPGPWAFEMEQLCLWLPCGGCGSVCALCAREWLRIISLPSDAQAHS